jgi:hypothetical protein
MCDAALLAGHFLLVLFWIVLGGLIGGAIIYIRQLLRA